MRREGGSIRKVKHVYGDQNWLVWLYLGRLRCLNLLCIVACEGDAVGSIVKGFFLIGRLLLASHTEYTSLTEYFSRIVLHV